MKKQLQLFFFLVLVASTAARLNAVGLPESAIPSPDNPDQPVRPTPTRAGADVAEVKQGQTSIRKTQPTPGTAAPRRKLSRQEKKIAKLFNKAYELLLYADKAREAKEWSNALRLYEDSLGQHQKLMETHPKWQPGVVKFRLAYCEIRVREMINIMDVTGGKLRVPTTTGEFVGPPRPPAREATQSSPKGNQATKPVMVGPPRKEDLDRQNASSAKKRPKSFRHGGQPDELSRIIAAGKQLLKSGQADDARAVLVQALKKDPDNAEARLLIGMAQCQQKSYNDAMHVMRSLIREHPKNAHAYLVLGTACFGLNRLDEAEIAMQQAIHLDPKLGEAHFNLAQIYLAGNPPARERARQHYARALLLGIPSDKRLEKGLKGK